MLLGLKRIRYWWPVYSFSIVSLSITLALPISVLRLTDGIESKLSNPIRQVSLLISPSGGGFSSLVNNLFLMGSSERTFNLGDHEELFHHQHTTVPILQRSFDKLNLLGTSHEYFNLFEIKFESGNSFLKINEAVIGKKISEQWGLKLGDKVQLPESDTSVKLAEQSLTVVGILERHHSPIDSTILVDLRTQYLLMGMLHRHGDTIHSHEDHSEPVSAVFLSDLSPKDRALLKSSLSQNRNLNVIQPDLFINDIGKKLEPYSFFLNSILLLVFLAILALTLLSLSLLIPRRYKEYQQLQEINFPRAQVKIMILEEVLIITLLAGICCFLVTWGVTRTAFHILGL